MSYEILYRRQFVKVDDNRVIPMVEAGSNNCFMQGKSGKFDKRARDWQAFTFYAKGAMIIKNDDLLAAIDAEREKVISRNNLHNTEYEAQGKPNFIDHYDDKKWGYFTGLTLYGRSTRNTSFASYRNFFKLGIEQAKTIEELKEIGVSISIRPCYYGKPEDLTVELKPTVYFESTEHMLATIAEYESFYADTNVNLYMDLSGEWGLEQEAIRQKQARRKKIREAKVSLTEFWVLKMLEVSGYFTEATRRGYRYSYHLSSAKKFRTEAAARKYWERSQYKSKMEPQTQHSDLPYMV